MFTVACFYGGYVLEHYEKYNKEKMIFIMTDPMLTSDLDLQRHLVIPLCVSSRYENTTILVQTYA